MVAGGGKVPAVEAVIGGKAVGAKVGLVARVGTTRLVAGNCEIGASSDPDSLLLVGISGSLGMVAVRSTGRGVMGVGFGICWFIILIF